MEVKELVKHILHHVDAKAVDNDPLQFTIQIWVGKARETR